MLSLTGFKEVSKLKNQFNISQLKTTDEIVRFLTMILEELTIQFNGKIDFDSNIRTSLVDVSFTTANAEKPITHTLDRVPLGYILAKSNVAVRLYDGATTNTASTIYIKADAISTTKVLIF